MLKIIYTLFILLLAQISFACKNVIYIDVSNIENLQEVVEITNDIIKSKPNENFIIYISNDDNPIIITNRERLNEELKNIFYIHPSIPMYNEEIKALNELLGNNNYCNNIETQTSNLSQKEIVNFYFILNLNQSIEYNQTKYFIDKLMLTNRLMFQHKLINNVKLKVYYDTNKSNYKIKQLSSTYKIKKYEIDEF
jgi:hypothetical protein